MSHAESGFACTAAGSGWQWSPMPWLIRAWTATVQSFGLTAAKQLAASPVERAAVDAAIEMTAPRPK